MNSRLAQSDHEPGFGDLGGAPLVHITSLQLFVWRTISLALVDLESFDLR